MFTSLWDEAGMKQLTLRNKEEITVETESPSFGFRFESVSRVDRSLNRVNPSTDTGVLNNSNMFVGNLSKIRMLLLVRKYIQSLIKI